MPFAVMCDGCQRLVREADQLTGQPPRCPRCREAIRAGADPGGIAEHDVTPRCQEGIRAAADRYRITPAIAENDNTPRVRCAHCAEWIATGTTLCPFCGEVPQGSDFAEYQRDMDQVGCLWMVLAFCGVAISVCWLPSAPYEIAFWLGLPGLSGLIGAVIAFNTMRRKRWALHAGLVMSYAWVIPFLLLCQGGMYAPVIGMPALVLLAAGIFSAHWLILQSSRQQAQNQ